MPKFTFDCELTAAITVEADDAATAKKMLIDALDCADTNFGAYPNGDPILGEVSLDVLDDGPAITLADDADSPLDTPEAIIARTKANMAEAEVLCPNCGGLGADDYGLDCGRCYGGGSVPEGH